MATDRSTGTGTKAKSSGTFGRTGRCDERWYSGTPELVAQRLLGCRLVRILDGQRLSGIIVEVEAYLSKADPASHSVSGPKRKNASMFEPAGSLYVYSIHSRHCMNVVTGKTGTGSAILIRALEPLEGLQKMQQNRGLTCPGSQASRIPWQRSLTSGPGRLCEALQVDRNLDGIDLTRNESIWIEPPPEMVTRRRWTPVTTPRIGIRLGQELPLRWIISGNHFVSGRAAEHPQGRNWRFLSN